MTRGLRALLAGLALAGIASASVAAAPPLRVQRAEIIDRQGFGKPLVALPIDDPARLLRWLAPDRAWLLFKDAADLAAGEAALVSLIAQWINHV
jgi:hypothetical protein